MKTTTANNVLAIAKKYLGYGTSDQAYEDILRTYNKAHCGQPKLCKGENWSAAFLSFCFIEAGNTMIIGRAEKDKKKLIAKLKLKRIYTSAGNNHLKVGDIVDFQDDSVGIIEALNGRVLTAIIGDKNGVIGRVRCLNSDKRIIGYARPKYATEKQAIDEIANEVILGKWGNGSAMVHKITAAGYDYDAIRRRVCELS